MILVYRTWRAAELVHRCLGLAQRCNVSTWWGLFWAFQSWLDLWAPSWLCNAVADVSCDALVEALRRGGRAGIE